MVKKRSPGTLWQNPEMAWQLDLLQARRLPTSQVLPLLMAAF